jgi:tetratricopeptide (TPR) repeat protein
MTWRMKHDPDKAIADFSAAIRLDPKLALAYLNRGSVWREKDDLDRAIADFDEAVRLEPTLGHARFARGEAWHAKAEHDKAIADFDEAIRLDPKNELAFFVRSEAWRQKGDFDNALADCDAAIRLDPKEALGYDARAWIRAACYDAKYRDGRQAVEDATRACELSDWKSPRSLGTLAAACAEAGDFAAAVKWQEKSLELSRDDADREKGRTRLDLYRSNKPYRMQPDAR